MPTAIHKPSISGIGLNNCIFGRTVPRLTERVKQSNFLPVTLIVFCRFQNFSSANAPINFESKWLLKIPPNLKRIEQKHSLWFIVCLNSHVTSFIISIVADTPTVIFHEVLQRHVKVWWRSLIITLLQSYRCHWVTVAAQTTAAQCILLWLIVYIHMNALLYEMASEGHCVL